MTAARLFIGGALIAVVLVLAAMVWIDRSTPITVVVNVIPEQELHLSIEGAVSTPGVVVVPVGARLQEVADAAGGFTTDADFTNLNLAGRVGDGERIVIPSRNDTQDPTSLESPVKPDEAGTVININTATAIELNTLPGIGDVLANRIIEYRDENGLYQSVDALEGVEGISGRMIEKLRPRVTVDDGS